MEKKFEEFKKELDEMFEENYTRSLDIFMKECTACGGNWVAMVWSGIKRFYENGALTDEEFKRLDEMTEELSGKAGVYQFELMVHAATKMVIREQLRLFEMNK